MEHDNVNVMVVDDTVVYRRIVSGVVEAIDGATVVATAANGKIALDKLRRVETDLILLDVEMPEMDGLATLKAVRGEYPDIGVIMVSGANRSSADITIRALKAGAMDFVPKPDGRNPDDSRSELLRTLRPLMKLFSTRRRLREATKASGSPLSSSGRVKPADSAPGTDAPTIASSVPTGRVGPKPTRIDVVAIGVSTGGPSALSEVIPRLPADLGKPVLVVQHMPPVFTKSLADGLAKKSALPVREASDGELIEPNVVLIAPGGKHTVVRCVKDAASGQRSYRIGLNDNPPENHCRPSVDVLFRSVAAQYGGNVLATIMTGMGEDGCEGVKAIKRQGCICLTQSEDSCVVYGMPRAVDEAGLSDESVALAGLAGRMAEIARNPAAWQLQRTA